MSYAVALDFDELQGWPVADLEIMESYRAADISLSFGAASQLVRNTVWSTVQQSVYGRLRVVSGALWVGPPEAGLLQAVVR